MNGNNSPHYYSNAGGQNYYAGPGGVPQKQNQEGYWQYP